MKIKIEMDEVEKEAFVKMCNQVDRLEIELCGGRLTNGFVKDMTSSFKSHVEDDKKSFEEVFKLIAKVNGYQNNQELFVGWSKKAIAFTATGLIFIGGLIGWTVTTIIALVK